MGPQSSKPGLIVLGQITVDHVVPARPGRWRIQLGGNALYAAAGARLWLDPERIGVVTRVGAGCPLDPKTLLERAGIANVSITTIGREQLVEWILYEEDGSRRSLPRNEALRTAGGERSGANPAYLAHLEAQSPAVSDVPPHWLPAKAAHLAPQVRSRHAHAVAALTSQVEFLSVDPSPHYTRALSVEGLARLLGSVHALLPSEQELSHLVTHDEWDALAAKLVQAGFGEVVLKLGEAGAWLCRRQEKPAPVPALSVEARDPTGAGDAFCGAYTACRSQGLTPLDSAWRAAVAAAMVVECEGAEAALVLCAAEARRRAGKGPGALRATTESRERPEESN